MGEVWHARDEQLRRDVAVKLMLTGQSDRAMFTRFEREAFMVARLRHPGIVQVHDVGWHGDQMFIVMELLGGSDLAKVMRVSARGLPVARAVDLAIQVADALSAIHAAGIIHRDIKPLNLFVQGKDALKILDFGIARDYQDWTTITLTGQTLGTPAYMAPELWTGERAGASSDLYALGCVLYEMLVGRSPFAGERAFARLYERHKSEQPVPPSARDRDIPAALSTLVLELLAKKPDKRPESAAVVAKRLREGERSAGREPRDQPQPIVPVVTVPVVTVPSGTTPPRAVPGSGTPVRPPAPVACASIRTGHLEVFVLDGSGGLRHRRVWPEPGRAGWQIMPPPSRGVSAVAAGSHDDDHEELAAVAGDTIYHRRCVNGRWSGWDAMPPLRAEITDVAFASITAGHLEAFALDSTGRIRHRAWPEGNGWSQWQDMPAPQGRAVTAIAAGAHSDMSQELFAIADGTVWQRSWGRAADGWSDWDEWQQLPPLGASAVDLAFTSPAPGHLTLFALDAAGGIHYRSYQSGTGWPAWHDVPAPGGRQLTAIAAGVHAGSYQVLFAVAADGGVRSAQSRLNDFGQPVWSSWRDIT
jgi:hypothetical protein